MTHDVSNRIAHLCHTVMLCLVQAWLRQFGVYMKERAPYQLLMPGVLDLFGHNSPHHLQHNPSAQVRPLREPMRGLGFSKPKGPEVSTGCIAVSHCRGWCSVLLCRDRVYRATFKCAHRTVPTVPQVTGCFPLQLGACGQELSGILAHYIPRVITPG